MRLGIFAKTFSGSNPLTVLGAVKAAGYDAAQFNMACAGLPPMPDEIPANTIATIREAVAETGIELVALSGTYNMIHPDVAVRTVGMRRLGLLLDVARELGIPLVTLCTGTRDPDDQWAHHPDNATPEAWEDLLTEMASAVALAEAAGVDLGIEPEQANVVTSAEDGGRLVEAIGSQRIRFVLDPANLFEVATAIRREPSWARRSTGSPAASPWRMRRTANLMAASRPPVPASSTFRISSVG